MQTSQSYKLQGTYLQELNLILIENIWNKSLHASSSGKGKGTILKCIREVCSLIKAWPLKKLVNWSLTCWGISDPNWLGEEKYPTLVSSSLPVGEGRYPTPAHSSYHIPPKGGNNWEILVKFTVQRHRFIERLIIGLQILVLPSQSTTLGPTYSSSFYPIHHIWLLRNNYESYQKEKQQQQHKIWRECQYKNQAWPDVRIISQGLLWSIW